MPQNLTPVLGALSMLKSHIKPEQCPRLAAPEALVVSAAGST